MLIDIYVLTHIIPFKMNKVFFSWACIITLEVKSSNLSPFLIDSIPFSVSKKSYYIFDRDN